VTGPIRWFARAIADPKIVRHLLADEGEVVVDEVRHHWVVYVVPVLEFLVALGLLVAMLFVPVNIASPSPGPIPCRISGQGSPDRRHGNRGGACL